MTIQYDLPANRAFSIDIAPKPMQENMYQVMIVPIIKVLEDEPDNWLTIGYQPKREDGITAIQVCKNEEEFHVELVVNLKNDKEFSIFAFDTLDVDLVLDMFLYVCVYYECLFDVRWESINGNKVQITDARIFNDRIVWKDITTACSYS